jgi:hypothetical protein
MIQELNKRLRQKDAQSPEMQASFTAQLKAMRDEFSARVDKPVRCPKLGNRVQAG